VCAKREEEEEAAAEEEGKGAGAMGAGKTSVVLDLVTVLWCVAVCCSVLHVAVCCSVAGKVGDTGRMGPANTRCHVMMNSPRKDTQERSKMEAAYELFEPAGTKKVSISPSASDRVSEHFSERLARL